MNAVQPTARMSLDDFLAWEAAQTERHEFLAGEVFAMTGARDGHNTIAGNIFAALRAATRGGPCRVFIADMKLRLDAADASFYPDVMVTRDPRDKSPEADMAKRHPTLIVEVLSESTAAYDRGLKFELYRGLDSLREYLLVEPERRHADLFRRADDNGWTLHSHNAGEDIELRSLATKLAMDMVYEDVQLTSQQADRPQ